MADYWIIQAVITVLIPIFTSQLEKSRESVDLANIRAAYAEVMTSALTDDKKDDGSVQYDTKTKTYTESVNLTQTQDEWKTDVSSVKIGDISLSGTTPKAKGTATITYKAGVTGTTSDPNPSISFQ